jgi:hypothetical protein
MLVDAFFSEYHWASLFLFIFLTLCPVGLAVGWMSLYASAACDWEIYVPLEHCSCVLFFRPVMAWELWLGRPTARVAALKFCVYSWLTTIVMDAKLQWLFLFKFDGVCDYLNVRLVIIYSFNVEWTEKHGLKHAFSLTPSFETN